MAILDVSRITDSDIRIISELKGKKVPVILALNKIDLVSPETILAVTARTADFGYDEIVPVSAKTKSGLDELEKCLQKHCISEKTKGENPIPLLPLPAAGLRLPLRTLARRW